MSKITNTEIPNQNGTNFLRRLDDLGFDYIKNKKHYLIFSALFPIFVILVQLLNFIFILNGQNQNPPPPPHVPGLDLIDIITPLIITSVIALFALLNFIFLLKWKTKVDHYEKQKKIAALSTANDTSNGEIHDTVPMTHLFYDIVDHMVNIRRIFFGLNIIVLFNMQWYIRFFLLELRLVVPDHLPILGPLPLIIQILNFTCQVSLFIYLIYEWKHFLSWNKKINRLKFLERAIYDELDL